MPSWRQVRAIGPTIWHHLKLTFPHERDYNVLQKLTYLVMVVGVLPLAVLTGLTMSPTMDTAFPELLFIFGGRQSARTIHFLCAFGFVIFFIVHIVMVILSGPLNNLRAIVTGRYGIEAKDG